MALDSKDEPEQVLYDVARYEVRNMIMSNPGAVAPVVFGGKIRAVMLYLDRIKMQARGLSPHGRHERDGQLQRVSAHRQREARQSRLRGELELDVRLRRERWARFRCAARRAMRPSCATWPSPTTRPSSRPTSSASTAAGRCTCRSTGNWAPARWTWSARSSKALPDMQARLSKSDINLNLVMDQSVYVAHLDLCAGAGRRAGRHPLLAGDPDLPGPVADDADRRHDDSAVGAGGDHLPVLDGQTINVMTLAGLALAIGPLVDSAIICLENTHRHLGLGADPEEAAFLGASEVAMPELVSTLCTFLVLAPLALMPGMGQFLFSPMALAVAFAMIAAYLLSRTLVPSFSALLLRAARREHDHAVAQPVAGRLRPLGSADRPRHRAVRARAELRAAAPRGDRAWPRSRCCSAPWWSSARICGASSSPRSTPGPSRLPCGSHRHAHRGDRAGASARSRTSIRKMIPEHDLEIIVSEMGVTPDWSAAYTPNAGPMDGMVKVQLHGASQAFGPGVCRACCARVLPSNPRFTDLEFSFDAGGMVRGALNEGKSSPLTIRVTGKDDKQLADAVAEAIKRDVVPHSRRGGRPRDPAHELSAVHDQRRSGQGGRPGAHARRRDAQRRRGVQFQHLVQQAQLLDRSGHAQPVLRRRAVSGKRHPIDRHVLDIPITEP